MSKPMFPHAIDSTMLATFRSCPQKFFRQYVQHWKPKAESVHLVAGGAFASGIEAARRAFYEGIGFHKEWFYEENDIIGISTTPVEGWECRKVMHDVEAGNQQVAEAIGLQALIEHYGDFECPPDSAKSLERTCGALEFYFQNYPLGADGMEPVLMASGKRGIEFSFAEPLPFAHPVSGDPILYTGRADAIMHFANGIYVVDEKTASSLGASWSRQWEMRAQFTGYCWACRQAGIEPAGTIIRGVSILKTKYDTQQAITYRAPWEIDRWLQQTLRDLERMVQMWRDDWYDYALDHACAEYGGCSMLQICKSQDPESWLPMYFEQRVWDPLLREEMTLEQWEASWNNTPAITPA